jgi:hypothetical protein
MGGGMSVAAGCMMNPGLIHGAVVGAGAGSAAAAGKILRSAGGGSSGGGGGGAASCCSNIMSSGGGSMQNNIARAPRMRWTSSLHAHFVHAVELLGGHESTLALMIIIFYA